MWGVYGDTGLPGEEEGEYEEAGIADCVIFDGRFGVEGELDLWSKTD